MEKDRREQTSGAVNEVAARNERPADQPLIDAWFRSYPALGPAAVQALMKLASAQRHQIMAQLHVRFGNAAVQNALAAFRLDDQAPGEEVAGPSGGGIISEEKRSADTSTPAQVKEMERREALSDNKTFPAMNIEMKLLASEMHATRDKLSFTMGIVTDKASVQNAVATIRATAGALAVRSRTLAKQLDELDIQKEERWKLLEEGGQVLNGAFADFQPVMDEIDAWLDSHKADDAGSFDELRVRTKSIFKLVRVDGVFANPKQLSKAEKDPSYVTFESINAHLDAAVTAAESVKSGNRHHANRIIMHVNEMAGLLPLYPRLSGGLEPRIKHLVHIVDQILIDNPYLKKSLDEAIDPIRNVK